MQAIERFFIDEDGFAFRDELPQRLQQTLETFLDVLDAVEQTGEVFAWEAIWDIESSSGRTLTGLLFESDDIDRDVRRLLAVRLARLKNYAEALNPSLTSTCDGQVTGISPGISLCARSRRKGQVAGCVTTDQSGRHGNVEVTDGVAAPVSALFLAEVGQVREFWRSVLEIEWALVSDLHEAAGWAYPQLEFAAGVWSQIRRFAGPAETARRLLLMNLTGLHEHAVTVWQQEVQPHLIAARMKALAGVDCSMDSPNTHGNSSAMREREVVFGGRTLLCEWHAKLERHQNRVHFRVQDGRVYVGIFVDHLST